MSDNNKWEKVWETVGAISRWLQVSVLLLIIVLGWLSDSLLSVLIGRARLSFREVYKSWKIHLLLSAK